MGLKRVCSNKSQVVQEMLGQRILVSDLSLNDEMTPFSNGVLSAAS